MTELAVHSFGYLAAILVFCTFYMRTMLPLRCMAIASNVAFLAYGVPLGLWPVAILHALLLPVNVVRLFQIRGMLANVHRARTSKIDVAPLTSSLAVEEYAQGTILFRKGDWGDRAYFIAKGEIDFPEIGVRSGVGQLFGEFAIFSPQHARTASAICASDAVLYRIDEQAIVLAFRAAGRFGELGGLQREAAQCADQHISRRGKPQPQLVGAHRRRRGAVGKEVELTLLDAVFHIVAGAVDLFVKLLRRGIIGAERGDNKGADWRRLGSTRPWR
jgi:CRP/FNR family transcriptional regulator, cyclic AMP receptor protein